MLNSKASVDGTRPEQSIAQRLDRLEAIEEVRHLKMTYARLCDQGYPADQLAELFTVDAVWDGGETLGRYEGREGIRTFFANSSQRVPWALHYTVAGDIQVDPNCERATATWYLWQPMIRNGEPTWLMGIYTDLNVREDGVWRFARVGLDARRLVGIGSDWPDAAMFSPVRKREDI